MSRIPTPPRTAGATIATDATAPPYLDAARLPAPIAGYRPLLTERQAADLLALSPRTLQAWRVRGGGPAFIKLGAAIRYDADALAAWVAEQQRANTIEPSPAA
jgi:hypothetical protein